MLLTKALIETNFGNIEFSLLPDLAPETVRNFTKLAESEFYNGTLFHRVIRTFLDREYTVFGEVTQGMDVADKIVNLPRDQTDCPQEDAKMLKVTITS